MSTKLVAEYGVADHLVVYSEGRISVWRRGGDVRPIRKRVMVNEQAAFEDAEWEAHKAREEQARLLRVKYRARR